jgi:hypothetical protein
VIDLHNGLGWFLIVSNAVVGIWALSAQYMEPLRLRAMWWAIGAAQVSVFVVAIVGVLLANEEGRVLDDFHALYGFTTIVAVGILYSYRTSPFIRDKQYLLYGFGSLFIMGLGIRALFLDGSS